MHQNIASILAKQEVLEITLQELYKTNNEPDLICLSETFLRSGSEKYLNIYNYELATAFSRDKLRGGTCILAKRNSIYKEMAKLKTYAAQKTFEVCGIEMPLHKLVVVCVYRTPTSDPNVFLNKLDLLLHDLSKNCKPDTKIVLTGDININTLKQGKVTKYLQDICLNHNLKIHINVPTRKKSCIDHMLSNILDAKAAVLPLYLSDHDTAQLLCFPVHKKKR